MRGSRRTDATRSARARPATDTSSFPDELDALLRAVTDGGIVLPDSARGDLLAYAEALVAWSSRVNLVSRAELPVLVEKHIGASLIPMLVDPAGVQTKRRVLDIGSGGGLPGIVLAVARPDWIVTCCEPLRRKTLFLTSMADRIANLRVRRERVEEAAGDPDLRAQCDLVTSRAVAPPAIVWPLARPLLTSGGELLVFVARDDHDTHARALTDAYDDALVAPPLCPSWHRGAVMRVRFRLRD